MTKKTFLFSAMLLFSISIIAQVRKIPAAVTEAFRNRYPHAVNVEWKDRLSCFEADFELNNSNMVTKFSTDGSWQSTERDIDFNDLPATVKDGFSKSKCADWEIKNITEVQTMAEPLQFKMIVKKGSLQKKSLLFASNGKLMKEGVAL